MCIKYVDHITYADGRQEVTERVQTCLSGHLCPHPETVHRSRLAPFSRVTLPLSPRTSSPSSGSNHTAHRAGSPYADFLHLNLPPSPRKSPSPSGGSDSSARRRARHHTSTILVNGALVDIENASATRPRRRTTVRRGDAAEAPPSPRIVLAAPEPPSPLRGRSLRRASTMPTNADYIVEEAYPRRHTRRSAAAAAIEPLDLDIGRRSSRRHRSPAPEPAPSPYVSVDKERERAERRRRRASTGLAGMVSSSSTFTPRDVPASAAATEVRKELRWVDQLGADIAAHNVRIAQRPRPRAGEKPAALHQEVRGILKNPSPGPEAAAGTVPEVVVTPSAARQRERERAAASYDELRRAVGGVDMPRRYETAAQRALREERRREREREREAAAAAEESYYDRLRGRFESGEERRRRSRVYYPGEGLYKYL